MSVASRARQGTLKISGARLLLLVLPAALLILALPASASEPGSCVGYCGGKSDTCYCDKACVGYGDCCPDFPSACYESKACGTVAGLKCGYGEFCEFPPGTCYVSDNAGACTATCDPYDCPHVTDPVCGCDGQTYSNSCIAKCEQVQIDHYGACTPPHCDGSGGSSAPAKAWILWRKTSPGPVLGCPKCDRFNSSGGAVKLVSNKSNRRFEFLFEDLGWKFKCDCSSWKGPLARPKGPRGILQLTLAGLSSGKPVKPKDDYGKDDDDEVLCTARFAQPAACHPGGASEDLRVKVDCSAPVSAFHLLFLR